MGGGVIRESGVSGAFRGTLVHLYRDLHASNLVFYLHLGADLCEYKFQGF